LVQGSPLTFGQKCTKRNHQLNAVNNTAAKKEHYQDVPSRSEAYRSLQHGDECEVNVREMPLVDHQVAV